MPQNQQQVSALNNFTVVTRRIRYSSLRFLCSLLFKFLRISNAQDAFLISFNLSFMNGIITKHLEEPSRKSLLPILAILLLLPALIHSQVFGQETTGDISPIDDETKNVINQGLAWLAKKQNEDGSFGGQGEYSQNVGVTALAGMAFLCDGNVPNAGQYSEQVEGCLDYLLSRSQVSGYIVETDEQVHGPMYGHGFATMFLAEVYGMSQRKDLREKLARAVDLIIATQNDQGGWRYNPVPEDADISVTVCQMMALRAARNAGISVPKEVIDRAVAYIKECQNPDGGFRYRLFDAAESKHARSAAALVALYTAGMAEEKVVERGFQYLNQQDRKPESTEYYYYSVYYSTQAYWHAGGETWQAAYPRIRDQVLGQVKEDHWSHDVTGDQYATAMALIALQIPKNLVPIFDR